MLMQDSALQQPIEKIEQLEMNIAQAPREECSVQTTSEEVDCTQISHNTSQCAESRTECSVDPNLQDKKQVSNASEVKISRQQGSQY